jgi:transcriptional regulator with XRE-family HTH domain
MTKSDQRRSEGAVKAGARSRLFFALQKAWKRRSAEGMTAKDLAVLLDRDKAYVSRVLNGRTPTITIETLALFLDRLGHRLVVDCVAAEDIPTTNVDARPKRMKRASPDRAAAE